jgi:hypothetical protein
LGQKTKKGQIMIKNIFKNINKVFLSIFGRELKIMVTFNGMGAFSYALKLLGVQIGEQVCCEIDEKANRTYIANNNLNWCRLLMILISY